jgi:hypothetical protein
MKEKIILSKDVIKDIAQNLEAGMNSWYHIPTAEVLSAPDRMKHDIEDELWEDTFDEIDEKMHECIAFECLETHEEFRIMQSFTENEVIDKRLQARLINALSNRKPFRHFKDIIDYSDYRQAWFAFRTQWYMEYVQNELDRYNEKDEEDN